jgi:hypothetical protein
MGNSDNPQMLFNLEEIYDQNRNAEDFQALEIPFTDKEIEDVVKNLPNENLLGLMVLIMSSSKVAGQLLEQILGS